MGGRLAIHVRPKIPTVRIELDERLLSFEAVPHLIEVVRGAAGRNRAGLDVLREEIQTDAGHRDDTEDADHDDRQNDPDPGLYLTGHSSSSGASARPEYRWDRCRVRTVFPPAWLPRRR